MSTGGVGLYIHVPFCTTKCGYCDFYSLPLADRSTAPLVECLIQELERRARAYAGRVSTVFIGGGTPTLLPPDDLRRLLETVAGMLGPDRVDEFTVEANPATLDPTKAAILVEAGVDRISFGAQSFHPGELAALERIHDPDDVERSIVVARNAGLSRINLDLIFGIPTQTLESWDVSITRALDLRPDHLALYGLTYEPGTALTAQYKRGQVQSCDEELERAMYNHAIDRLADAGFEHYEISNFARPGQRCRHNVAYWRNAEYVGFGPSAASFLDRRRLRNVANLTEYVRRMHTDGEAIDESERLEPLAFAGETAMLSLRMTDGIEAAGFASTTGYDPFVLFAEPIRRHTAAGLLATDNHRIRLTRAGLCVADAVMADFLDPTAPNENTLVRESFLAPTEAGILSRVVTRQGNRHGDQVN